MQPFKYQPNISSGQFRHRIAIYGPKITEDSLHQQIQTFEEITKVWSMIRTTQGREFLAAAQNNAEHTTRFVVRYSSSLATLFNSDSTQLEVRYDGNVYNIESIINDEEADKTFTIIAKGRV